MAMMLSHLLGSVLSHTLHERIGHAGSSQKGVQGVAVRAKHNLARHHFAAFSIAVRDPWSDFTSSYGVGWS